MNEVLEFVGNGGKIIIAVDGNGIEIDIKDFAFVGKRVDRLRVFIGKVKSSGNVAAQLAGMKDVESEIPIYAGLPFAAEKGAVGGQNYFRRIA